MMNAHLTCAMLACHRCRFIKTSDAEGVLHVLNLGGPRCCKANVPALLCGDKLTLGKALKGSNSQSCLQKAGFALPALPLAVAARFARAPDTEPRERMLDFTIGGSDLPGDLQRLPQLVGESTEPPDALWCSSNRKEILFFSPLSLLYTSPGRSLGRSLPPIMKSNRRSLRSVSGALADLAARARDSA